jgi:hypothetical protein
MRTCDYCGEEIEFRYIDGGPKPIHISGRWCAGDETDFHESAGYSVTVVPKFPSTASKRWSIGHLRCELGLPLTPPTTCPICGQVVFFHTIGFCDCVFFDALDPPWPKHGCFSNEDGIRLASRSPELMAFVDKVIPPTHIPLLGDSKFTTPPRRRTK